MNDYKEGERNGFKIAHLKKKLQDAHGNACSQCGCTKEIEAHHIVPVASGGKDTLDNLQLLCRICHLKIHGRGKGNG